MPKQLIQSGRVALVTLLLSVFIPCSAQAQEDTSMMLGLYVVVDDMDNAKQFYRQLFGAEPSVDYRDFVSFRFGQGIFALYSEHTYSHPLKRGNNIVPYFQVTDIEAEFERVSQLSPKLIHNDIVDEGVIQLFMFTDPSGNKLEFYSLD